MTLQTIPANEAEVRINESYLAGHASGVAQTYAALADSNRELLAALKGFLAWWDQDQTDINQVIQQARMAVVNAEVEVER